MEFVLLILPIFFEKFPRRFVKFFKNRKITIIFEPKLVQNRYIDQNLAKFSLKLQKNFKFFLKNFYFLKNFPPSAPKICSFGTQKTQFFVVRASWGQPPPQFISDNQVSCKSSIENIYWERKIFCFFFNMICQLLLQKHEIWRKSWTVEWC